MMSTASAPASCATAVSSNVSSSFAEPVPGTKGTRSAISAAAVLIDAARSAVVCALGSPVEPPSEMPWEPEASCHRIRDLRDS
jgi:hypothetical protein